MTDREKQVEEMQDILINNGVFNNLICRQDYAYPDALISDMCRETAEIVFNNGYRKMDEITLKLDLGDRSAEEIQQIAEAFNKAMANEQTLVTVPSNEEEIAKRVAKEIYKRVDEFRKSPELNPRDSYDCNALDAYNNVCKFINRKYGVEIEK